MVSNILCDSNVAIKFHLRTSFIVFLSLSLYPARRLATATDVPSRLKIRWVGRNLHKQKKARSRVILVKINFGVHAKSCWSPGEHPQWEFNLCSWNSSLVSRTPNPVISVFTRFAKPKEKQERKGKTKPACYENRNFKWAIEGKTRLSEEE